MPGQPNCLYISVDVETNGPVPGLYSMIELGAVVVEPGLQRSFFGQYQPCNWYSPSMLAAVPYEPEALKAINRTHQETLAYPYPREQCLRFFAWLVELKAEVPNRKLVFVSDNNGFDWSFVNFYLHYFCNQNQFGHSSRNLNDLYRGIRHSWSASLREIRTDVINHNALDDARVNAGAMLHILDMMHK